MLYKGKQSSHERHHPRHSQLTSISHRVREIGQPIPETLLSSYQDHQTIIRERLTAVAPDLQGTNAYRYARNISGGCQEFMEATSFQHYLATGHLLSYPEAVDGVKKLDASGGPGVHLSPEDYLLGIYDMTGELMKFAITTMAIFGTLPTIGESNDQGEGEVVGKAVKRSVLTDMRELRMALEGIDAKTGPWARDVDKKAEVMRTSVEKVERAFYGVVVRGAERPSGWMPDVTETNGSRTVEVES